MFPSLFLHRPSEGGICTPVGTDGEGECRENCAISTIAMHRFFPCSLLCRFVLLVRDRRRFLLHVVASTRFSTLLAHFPELSPPKTRI